MDDSSTGFPLSEIRYEIEIHSPLNNASGKSNRIKYS